MKTPKISTKTDSPAKNPGEFWLDLNYLAEEGTLFPIIVLLCSLFGFFLPAILPFTIFEHTIVSCVIFAVFFLTLSVCLSFCIANFSWLSPYGLSKREKAWVIDFQNGEIKEVELVRLHHMRTSFKKSVFECLVDNDSPCFVNGEDIFFSLEDAKEVLAVISKINDDALKRYLPNWNEDKVFLDFLSDWFKSSRRFGLGCFDTNVTYFLFTPVEINGIEYTPKVSARPLLSSFLDKIASDSKREEKESVLEKELLLRVNEYQSQTSRKEKCS